MPVDSSAGPLVATSSTGQRGGKLCRVLARLGTQFIEDLLALVDQGDADVTAGLTAERSRLQLEVDRLVASIAVGVPAEAVAPVIRDHHAAIAKLDMRLRLPRPAQPKIEELRAALEHRATAWRETLRAEPRVAGMLLRRLIGPLEMWDPAAPSGEWTEWEASLTPALLEGRAPIQVVASPGGFATRWSPRLSQGLQRDFVSSEAR